MGAYKSIILLLATILCDPFAVIAAESTPGAPFNINSPLFPPHSTKNKDGFEDLLAIELYTRLGFVPVVSHVPSERGFANLSQGLDDAMLGRVGGLSKLYPDIVQMNEPITEVRYGAFSKNKNIRISDWNGFSGLDVAIIRGWKIFERNITSYASMTHVYTAKQLFQLLDADRVDVVAYAYHPGKWMIRNLGLKNIHAVDTGFEKRKLYFYMHKKHELLIPKADIELRRMRKDGSYKKIYKQTILDKGLE